MTQKSRPRATTGPVLVTGGAGFLGSHVVEALLARGSEVRVLDDLSTGCAGHLPLHDPNLELVTGDVGDPAAVAAALRGMRACIHLAARPQPCGRAGMEKLLAEGYAVLHAHRDALQTLALRYFNVYGPRQRRRDGVIPRFLGALEARRPLPVRGDGHQRRDFIHAEDAARATVAALDSSCCGALNVASGRPTTIRELARLVGDALDARPLLHFVPAGPGEAADGWADITRLREATGFVPAHGLRAGLAALAGDRAAQRRRAQAAAAPAALPRVPPAARVVRLAP